MDYFCNVVKINLLKDRDVNSIYKDDNVWERLLFSMMLVILIVIVVIVLVVVFVLIVLILIGFFEMKNCFGIVIEGKESVCLYNFKLIV